MAKRRPFREAPGIAKADYGFIAYIRWVMLNHFPFAMLS
jgi:hypothetical protein